VRQNFGPLFWTWQLTGARRREMTRKPDAASLPPQIEVMRGDLTVPDTLEFILTRAVKGDV